MTTLPRTCPKCGASILHYGACACEAVPRDLEDTFARGTKEIKIAALDGAIAIVEEAGRLGLTYERCIEHLRSFRNR